MQDRHERAYAIDLARASEGRLLGGACHAHQPSHSRHHCRCAALIYRVFALYGRFRRHAQRRHGVVQWLTMRSPAWSSGRQCTRRRDPLADTPLGPAHSNFAGTSKLGHSQFLDQPERQNRNGRRYWALVPWPGGASQHLPSACTGGQGTVP